MIKKLLLVMGAVILTVMPLCAWNGEVAITTPQTAILWEDYASRVFELK